MSHKGQYVASFAHMIVSGHMTVTNPLFIRLIRLKNSRFFFLKISKEIGEACRKSLTRAQRESLTRP